MPSYSIGRRHLSSGACNAFGLTAVRRDAFEVGLRQVLVEAPTSVRHLFGLINQEPPNRLQTISSSGPTRRRSVPDPTA